MHDVVGQMEGKAVGESLARRADHYFVVVGGADAVRKPGARRIAVRNEFENVLPEQEAQLGGEIGNRPGLALARAETSIHRGEGLLVRQDGRLDENGTPSRVIEVT